MIPRESTSLGLPQGLPPDDYSYLGEVFDCYDDIMLEAEPEEHWFNCLRESCYSIANSIELRNWLLSGWMTNPPEKVLGLDYLLWQTGKRYFICDGLCVVYDNA